MAAEMQNNNNGNVDANSGFLKDISNRLSHEEHAPIWDKYRAHTFKEHKDLVTRLQSPMGDFLLFATLFSVVVSPFLVAANSLLQPDVQQETLAALSQISAQLAATGAGTSTPSPYDNRALTTDPPVWGLAVNALWMVSLLLSLVATVFAVSTKLSGFDPFSTHQPHI
ncbi:hypothetical protein CALVIDRAFT_566183 [Calocera viscosa TUFC12733]|uniref:DUF6535 domain-containing protein n=1 Tax=Calocera viscosa (strain TUFC12733) TaxID=1330018 RepID=A0A167JVM8_CALVF|nr:hypothetical protein CALVIDRAFT_566183 [Calocera viscosa TUFC12733]